VDLIEEVARLVGFDNIPYDVPSFKIKPNDLPADEVLGRRIRYTLSSMGLHECISLRFTSAANTQAVFGEPNDADPRSKPAKLLNPLSEELGCVPTSLIPILLKSVADNEKNRPGSVRLFENGKAQFQNAERKDERDPGFTEKPILCAVIAGHWKMEALDDKPRDVEFGDIKGLAISLFKRLGLAVEVRSVEKKEKFLKKPFLFLI
jgi:phenylalanyl-tRNA synthetase beta chain